MKRPKSTQSPNCTFHTDQCFYEPQLIRGILVRDFSNFHDRPLHVDEESKPKWRDLRAKMSQVFSSEAIKSLFPVLADFLERSNNNGNSKFDLEDLFFC